MRKDQRIPSHLEWSNAGRPIRREEITTIEQHLGVIFPALYVDCVMAHNGARVRPHDVDVPGRGISVLNGFLPVSAQSNEKTWHLLDQCLAMRGRLRDGVIPFGSDPAGNLFCFDYSNPISGEPSIVFWDHEFELGPQERAIFRICGSFAEFLSLLHNSISEEDEALLKRLRQESAERRKRQHRNR